MEILTEFDGLQEAMKKINMDESVMPYVNGRLVDNNAFNKAQRILNCPEMISAHRYLYNLDMDQLTENEIAKIDQLYKLGCDRGFIVDDLTDWDKCADEAPAKAAETPSTTDTTADAQNKPVAGSLFKAKIPCWTIIYSATSKDGDIKTGEAYSNAISASAAKADVNAKLSRIGYSNISILAIEASTDDSTSISIGENDLLNGRVHNNHVTEADTDDSKDADSNDEKSEDEEKSTDADDADDADDSADADEKDADEPEEGSETNNSDGESKANTEDNADAKDDGTEDADSDDSSKEDAEDEKDAEDEESDENDTDEKTDDTELDANQKAELKDKYRKTFKNVLVKCKFASSFNDLTLEQKVKFFTELSKAWTKNEPSEFMTDKEIEQLNNVVVKVDSDD